MTQRHDWGWSDHLTSVKNNKKCGPRHMLRQIRMTAVKNNDYRPRPSVVSAGGLSPRRGFCGAVIIKHIITLCGIIHILCTLV